MLPFVSVRLCRPSSRLSQTSKLFFFGLAAQARGSGAGCDSLSHEKALRGARYLAWLDFWDVGALEKSLHEFRFHQGLERLVQGNLRGVGYIGTRARGTLTAFCQPSVAWRKKVLAAKAVKFQRDIYYELKCDFSNGKPGQLYCACSTR